MSQRRRRGNGRAGWGRWAQPTPWLAVCVAALGPVGVACAGSGTEAEGKAKPSAAVGASAAGAAVAPAAPAGEQASRRIVQVLLPGVSLSDPMTMICLNMYLAERLGALPDVELVRSERGVRVARWLAGGAFDRDGRDVWPLLRSSIGLDAMVSMRHLGMDTSKSEMEREERIEVTVSTPAGERKMVLSFVNRLNLGPEHPASVARGAVEIVKALGLGEAAQKAVADPRIDNTPAFTSYYATYTANAPWPGNPYNQSPGLVSIPEEPYWATDVAAVRVMAASLKASYESPKSKNDFVLTAVAAQARAGLVRLLGTEHEPVADALMAVPRFKSNAGLLDGLEPLLLELAKPLIYGRNLPPRTAGGSQEREEIKEIDDIESVGSVRKPLDGVEVVEKPSALSTVTGQAAYTQGQRLGAARMLGRMASEKALPLLERLAKRADPAVRQAVATALGSYEGEAGLTTLDELSRDDDPATAFLAGRSLSRRGRAPADLRTRAAALLGTEGPVRKDAALALIDAATKAELPLLDQLTRDADHVVRAKARRAIVPLSGGAGGSGGSGGDPARLMRSLADTDAGVLLEAIRQAPPNPTGALYERLVQLANDPDATLAWAARDALASTRPADPRGVLRFDLTVAAPYLRQKLVTGLATRPEPWAREELLAACNNGEPHTRIAALRALTGADPAAAAGALVKATADPHRLVRLHAAALLATLPASLPPDTARAGAIEAAAARETNPATRLYLRDALAIAQGKPLPPPAPEVKPVNSILGGRNIAWLTSGGDPDSPFGAYYQMSDRVHELGQKAHDKGKAFFVRVSPIGDAGLISVDPLAQDDYWLGLDHEIDPQQFPYIDGLVYGEESMSLSPSSLWHQGWRLFCADVGLDPKRIAGDQKNLNRYEANAWKVWGMRRGVEGFNRLYDYTKLQYGKLRPGIQVATFLGEQALWDGPNEADFDWKFDVGGVYHYWGDSRKTSYSLVRRHKTIWPDRPVLWLSEGIGVYERTPVFHHTPVPKGPMISERWRHAYVDAMTAWMAGADTGWFSIWMFLKPEFKGPIKLKGPSIRPEQITPDSPALAACIDYAFNGVDEMFHTRDNITKEAQREIALPPTVEERRFEAMIDVLQRDEDYVDPITQQVKQSQADMNLGFQFYRKYIEDLGRLFSSLPRNVTRPDTLVIQPGLNVWEGSMGSPGSDLATYFDFLLDITKAPKLDLARYRVIAVKDPGPLTDATITSITRWLKETPGLLYVHLHLTADNADQFGTPEAFDGRLKTDWPWEPDTGPVTLDSAPGNAPAPRPAADAALDLTGDDGKSLKIPGAVAARSFKITGPNARALLTHDGKPVLVLWRHPDFKGAVVFDGIDGGGVPYRKALADLLNRVHDQAGVGIRFDGPVRHIRITNDQWTAESTNGGDEVTLRGVDLISSERNPMVGPGRNAAFVGKNFEGRFAAAYNGVSVLCEKPIQKVEKIEGGIRLRGDGLIQAACDKGELVVKPESGAMPPTIAPADLNDWLIKRKDEGVAVLPNGPNASNGALVYVRCARPLVLTAK